jgi:hypothetical protein
VNVVPFVNLVRTRISFRFSLPEREISHKGHNVHQIHKQNRLAASRHFPLGSFANRSRFASEASGMVTSLQRLPEDLPAVSLNFTSAGKIN